MGKKLYPTKYIHRRQESGESLGIIKNIRKENSKEIMSPITLQKLEECMKKLMTEDRSHFLGNHDNTMET